MQPKYLFIALLLNIVSATSNADGRLVPIRNVPSPTPIPTQAITSEIDADGDQQTKSMPKEMRMKMGAFFAEVPSADLQLRDENKQLKKLNSLLEEKIRLLEFKLLEKDSKK